MTEIHQQNLIEAFRRDFPELEDRFQAERDFWDEEREPSNYDFVFHELRKNCLTTIHPSLSGAELRHMSEAVFDQKKFKWKNLQTPVNHPTIKPLAGFQNSSLGQQ